MKKIMSLMLGMTLVIGAASMAFAQAPPVPTRRRQHQEEQHQEDQHQEDHRKEDQLVRSLTKIGF